MIAAWKAATKGLVLFFNKKKGNQKGTIGFGARWNPTEGSLKVPAGLGGSCRSEVKFTRGQFVLFHKGSLKVCQVFDRAEPGAADTKKRFIPERLEGKIDKKN